MRRVQVMRRAARRPLTGDEPVETAATAAPESALRRRRTARDAEVAGTLGRIDEVTPA
jgi:hypothetical protein